MPRFLRPLLILAALSPLYGQAPTSLQVTNVYNITSSTQVFDNRSIQRQCNNSSFGVVSGVGSWSVQLEYADTASSGPWTSFGSGAMVTASSPLNVGVGHGFHNFFRLNTTAGTTVVALSCEKDFFLPSGGSGGGAGNPGGNPGDFQVNVSDTSFGGVTPPIPTNLGGTGTVSPGVTCMTGIICTGTWPNITYTLSASPAVYVGTPYQEVPSGTINGTNPTFTLTNTPNSATLNLYRNGVFQKPGGIDYSLSTSTITFQSGAIPQTGDLLFAAYQYGSNAGGGGNATTINGAAVPASVIVVSNSSSQLVNGSAAIRNVNNRAVLRDSQNALDNGNFSSNGIAGAITACGTSTACQVMAGPSYSTSEAMPGEAVNWYGTVPGVPCPTSSNITALDQRYGTWWIQCNPAGNNTSGSRIAFNINQQNNNPLLWTQTRAYENLIGMSISQENVAGGINVNNGNYTNKTNFTALNVKEQSITQGQHNVFGIVDVAGGMGDALGGSITVICSGGRNAGTDEGCKSEDRHTGQPSGSYAGTLAGISGLHLTVTNTEEPDTQGEGRTLIDLNGSHTITTGTVSSVSPSASGPTTITFSGVSLSAPSVKATLGTAVTTLLTASTTVTPTSFTSGSISGITTSTVVCVADVGATNPGGYEMVIPTAVGGSTFTAVFLQPHLSSASIQVGGLCGYGLDLTADDITSANSATNFPAVAPVGTIRTIWPVISNTASQALVFNSAGGLWDPFNTQYQNISGLNNYVLYPMSIVTGAVDNCGASTPTCASPDSFTVMPSNTNWTITDSVEETMGPIIEVDLGIWAMQAYQPAGQFTGQNSGIYFSQPLTGNDCMWCLFNNWPDKAYSYWNGTGQAGAFGAPDGVVVDGPHKFMLHTNEPGQFGEIDVDCPGSPQTCTKNVGALHLQNVTAAYDFLDYNEGNSSWQFSSGNGSTAVSTIVPATGAAGTGYSVGDTFSVVLAGGSGATGTVAAAVSGVPTYLNILNHGTGYTFTAGSTTTALTGVGTGMQVLITSVSGGTITGLSIFTRNEGSGYANGDTFSIDGGVGGQGTVTSTSGGKVTGVSILAAGTSGYVVTVIPTTTTLTGTGSGLEVYITALEGQSYYMGPEFYTTNLINLAPHSLADTTGCTGEFGASMATIGDANSTEPGSIITGGGGSKVIAACVNNQWVVMSGVRPSSNIALTGNTGPISSTVVCPTTQCGQGNYMVSVPFVITSTGSTGTVVIQASFGDGFASPTVTIATVVDTGVVGSVPTNPIMIHSDGSLPISIQATSSGNTHFNIYPGVNAQ